MPAADIFWFNKRIGWGPRLALWVNFSVIILVLAFLVPESAVDSESASLDSTMLGLITIALLSIYHVMVLLYAHSKSVLQKRIAPQNAVNSLYLLSNWAFAGAIRWIAIILGTVPPEVLVQTLDGDLALFRSYAFLLSSLCAIVSVLNSFLKLIWDLQFDSAKHEDVSGQ